MAVIKYGEIKSLKNSEIFVFGSNLAGIHGAGAAKTARLYFGAKYGIGEGLAGNSYALPTKDGEFNVRSLDSIFGSILKLKECANHNSDKTFYLTRIGQGYAGLNESQIKPLIIRADLPTNVLPWWDWES